MNVEWREVGFTSSIPIYDVCLLSTFIRSFFVCLNDEAKVGQLITLSAQLFSNVTASVMPTQYRHVLKHGPVWSGLVWSGLVWFGWSHFIGLVWSLWTFHWSSLYFSLFHYFFFIINIINHNVTLLVLPIL